jgi:hypothetical protein
MGTTDTGATRDVVLAAMHPCSAADWVIAVSGWVVVGALQLRLAVLDLLP